MTAVRFDMQVEQGSDWAGVSVPMFQSDGQPLDVTGCSAKGQIKLLRSDALPVFSWSSTPGAGVGLITLTGHSVSWRLLGSESAAWAFSLAEYQIELHNPAAPVGDRDIRVAQGAVIVDAELYRS